MNSTQDFRHHSPADRLVAGMLSFKHRVTNWINQELFADDPCDEETLFLASDQLDKEDTRQLNLFDDRSS